MVRALSEGRRECIGASEPISDSCAAWERTSQLRGDRYESDGWPKLPYSAAACRRSLDDLLAVVLDLFEVTRDAIPLWGMSLSMTSSSSRPTRRRSSFLDLRQVGGRRDVGAESDDEGVGPSGLL